MKIFDCFMFCDEEMLLDLRLNCMDKYVDKFVIVESKYLHNGEEKKPIFDMDLYPKFKDKINYVLVEDQPDGLFKIDINDSKSTRQDKEISNACLRDNFQRNQINRGIKDAEDDDFIMVSDLDEIPKLENFNLHKTKNKFVFFKQKAFYYKFNLYLESLNWYGTKVCRKKHLKSPQWLRWIKDRNYSFWRIDTFFSETKHRDIYFVDDGGWHFSYIKNPENIEKKLKTYCHHIEYEKSGIDLGDIKNIMTEKRVIYDFKVDQRKNKFNSKEVLKAVELDVLPNYIVNNLEKYKNWLDLEKI